MTRWFAALALAGSVCAAESLDLSSPALIAEGSVLFAKSCAVGYCHGSEGRAARGPALRDRVWDPHEFHRITANGLPGTSMPGWQGVLPDLGVWAVTAYVLSLANDPPSGQSALIELEGGAEPAARAALSAEAARGKDLFFDLTRQRRCGVCHELDGLGTSVGPNLALAASAKTADEWTRDILDPGAEIAYGFEQVQLELRSGERLEGVLEEETESQIRIYDSASVPPPLRFVAKRGVLRQRTQQRSAMPDDLGSVYTAEEIAAIVAYLSESAR